PGGADAHGTGQHEVVAGGTGGRGDSSVLKCCKAFRHTPAKDRKKLTGPFKQSLLNTLFLFFITRSVHSYSIFGEYDRFRLVISVSPIGFLFQQTSFFEENVKKIVLTFYVFTN
ncbi:MAG: hypothetical protein LUC35_02090, partial [Clostridiales bacterium]|nr:hypothetical protein [Clostridiales bacterium]